VGTWQSHAPAEPRKPLQRILALGKTFAQLPSMQMRIQKKIGKITPIGNAALSAGARLSRVPTI
jgi:hypothetical protein